MFPSVQGSKEYLKLQVLTKAGGLGCKASTVMCAITLVQMKAGATNHANWNLEKWLINLVAEIESLLFCLACECPPSTHAFNYLHARVGQIAFVNTVEAGDVRVAGFFEGGPIKLSTRNLHTEVLCFLHHIHDVGTVPHNLFKGRENEGCCLAEKVPGVSQYRLAGIEDLRTAVILCGTLLQLLMNPVHDSHLFGDASNVDTRSTHRLRLYDAYLRRGV